MGVSLTSVARSRRVLVVGIAGLALLVLGVAGDGPARPVSAASCANAELQAVGAPTLSSCGVSRLRATPSGANEVHFASGRNAANGASEAQQPQANAHAGRVGRGAAPASASAAAVGGLPAHKTIDISQLPAGLVSPAK